MGLVWELMSEEDDGLYSNVAKVRWMGGDGGWMGQKSVDVLQSELDGESSSSASKAVGNQAPSDATASTDQGSELVAAGRLRAARAALSS